MSRDLTLYLQHRDSSIDRWRFCEDLEESIDRWWCFSAFQQMYKLDTCKEIAYHNDNEGYRELDFSLVFSFGGHVRTVSVEEVLNKRRQLCYETECSHENCPYMVELCTILSVYTKQNPDKEYRLAFGEW